MSLVNAGNLVNGLSASLQARNEDNFAWANVVSMYELLPNILGFWPMSNNTPVSTSTSTFTPLTTPLTSTSWNGDAKASSDSGIIDLSAVFSAPAGIKAIAVRLAGKDGTVGGNISLGPSSTHHTAVQVQIQVADKTIDTSGVCPCDANGDIYFHAGNDFDYVYIEIWGYWHD